jgi:transcriptional regulator with XRE-family HTH domain
MGGSSSRQKAGAKLKELREGLGLTLRAVQTHSKSLAEKNQNYDFFISRAWLNSVENGEYTPGPCKLYTLGAIYHTHWTNLFAFYGLNLRDFERDQAMFAPPNTQLVPEDSSFGDSLVVPMMQQGNLPLDKTNLISRLSEIWGTVPIRALQHLDLRNGVYGVIGASDFTMYPLLRPGSIVQIDENQTKPSQVKWKNEHDRPIYFIELRKEFICSWCEIQEGTLLAVPYPSPNSEIRKFAHPREAEVVGRVTSVAAMQLAGPQP